MADELNPQAAELAAAWHNYRKGGEPQKWNAARFAFAAWAGDRYLMGSLPPVIQAEAVSLLGELGQLGGLPGFAEKNPAGADQILAELLVRISALERVRRAWIAASGLLSPEVEQAADDAIYRQAWTLLASASPAALLLGLATGSITGDDLAAHPQKVAAKIGEGVKALASAAVSPLLPLLGAGVIAAFVYFGKRRRR